MRVAGLLEQVGRHARFERARAHPAGRPHADVLLDHLGAFRDRARLVMLPHRAQHLGIGAAVPEHVVAARLDLLDDLRIVMADAAVEQDRRRQLQLVEDLEQPPVADAVAVVAPGEIARGLRAGAVARVHADAGAEGEVLDVERNVEGQPLALRPAVIGPRRDRRIVIAVVAGKLQHRSSPVAFEIVGLMKSTARLSVSRKSRRRQGRRRRNVLDQSSHARRSGMNGMHEC